VLSTKPGQARSDDGDDDRVKVGIRAGLPALRAGGRLTRQVKEIPVTATTPGQRFLPGRIAAADRRQLAGRPDRTCEV